MPIINKTDNVSLILFPSFLVIFVRMEGLEPPRLSAPDPKSGTATNYATCALYLKRDANISLICEGL